MPPRLLEELKQQLKVVGLFPLVDTFILPKGIYTQQSHRQYKWSITALDITTKQIYQIYSIELTATQCSRGKQKFFLQRSNDDHFVFNVIPRQVKMKRIKI
jgi:hypothetical protein